tara:strand:- start:7909 stop:8742 length:834 start_codon:yes stop_codon:yes gene_type:complete
MGDTTPEHSSPPVAAIDSNVFSFVAPTEFVKLPSEGKYYAPDHPLFNQPTIEIKQMTAKEEDILTSVTLLQNGVAMERLLESIIVNKNIDPNSLLVGDRNAIIISTRVSGYGNVYKTKITCTSCVVEQSDNFDLNTAEVTTASEIINNLPEGITMSDNGTFSVVLPKSQLNIALRLLVGKDEKLLANQIQKNDNGIVDRIVTTQLKHMIASVNGNNTPEAIEYVSDNLPSSDSAFLRGIYKHIVPNIKLKLDFVCKNCSHTEVMEVPLTAEFFWPEQ